MKRTSLSNGVWLGGITGEGLLALLYLANRISGAPWLPLDFWNWQARLVPRNLLSLAVSGISHTLSKLVGAPEAAWGKTSEQIGAHVLLRAPCATGGWIAARSRRQQKGSDRRPVSGSGPVSFCSRPPWG